jgi:hypothetical protein
MAMRSPDMASSSARSRRRGTGAMRRSALRWAATGKGFLMGKD